MKLRKKRKQNNDAEELDITALLDILVILLVFLLKSFNDSDLTVDLVNELSLPYSMSRTAGHHGVILQVNKKGNVFINSDLLGNVDGDETFGKMKEVLMSEYRKRSTEKEGEKKKKHLINFVFDRGLKYAVINKVMNVSSEIGFGKYKFIIQGEE
ncbi:MAG: hypothetical protein HON90_14685 [Halobacteriovoraceae bacterium]|jgi:biopolymer transport protein ExbD|nr:hypothetical protein [Halobacteriovoraceae bacterium]